jgi:2',3'-cyclic-nucleotide 2'-phosphodiesterase (5'-nucleotidase family)
MKVSNTNFLILFTGIFYALFLCSCSHNVQKINRIEGKLIPVSEETTLDEDIENFVKPYREHLESEMSEVLAYAPQFMDANRADDETMMGNFLADISYKRANPVFNKRTGKNIDFVLLNIGGIRAKIQKGDVTVRDAYEVMPFENIFVVAKLSYEAVNELITYLEKSGNPHPISHQLRVTFRNDDVRKVLLQGKPLDPNKSYYVLTNDYLFNGGDRMDFFQKATEKYVLDYKVRAALLDELKDIDTIHVALDGRMKRQ